MTCRDGEPDSRHSRAESSAGMKTPVSLSMGAGAGAKPGTTPFDRCCGQTLEGVAGYQERDGHHKCVGVQMIQGTLVCIWVGDKTAAYSAASINTVRPMGEKETRREKKTGRRMAIEKKKEHGAIQLPRVHVENRKSL